ncbi:M23 family metallopeptidase [Merismopedia glauca]|uniref:M23ase beta-sheet core domain-containing protein n=1 Tax=Merismopedia glauca CCAP 1448/3 TaxID=1296344 RepID=A0A2T1C265_9CYAN|nr:M23 family metallopeptidase [Merismopedia glauca]PSB02366.1 hypothetical protein C7B64_13600 [Merismopedia glauca CCAP 1448/3]
MYNLRIYLAMLVFGLWLLICSPASALTCDMSQYNISPVTGTKVDYGNTRWPVNTIQISDPFGSRYLAKNTSTGCYDYHRGLDLQGTEGDTVYSIAAGTVYIVQYECKKGALRCGFPNGGNVAVVEHPLTFKFNDKPYTKYYSVYLHLHNFDIGNNQKLKQGQPVVLGSPIGKLGRTGASYDHLHFEIRLGDINVTERIDPSVNPLYFLEEVHNVYRDTNNYTVCVSKSPLTVSFSSSNQELDFNEIEIQSAGETRKINFSTKEGIDLTQVDNSSPYGLVTINPADFKFGTPEYLIDFQFPGLDENFTRIFVRDIWGNGLEITPKSL